VTAVSLTPDGRVALSRFTATLRRLLEAVSPDQQT
jgi:hypothetical protein